MNGESISNAIRRLPDRHAYLAVCGVLPFVMALAGVTFQGPWFDEIYTLNDARLVGPDPTAWISGRHQTLPVYQLVAWIFSLGGESLLGARLASVLAFAGAVLCFSGFAWRYFGLRTALVYGAVMSLHPQLIWHAQDARMYALVLAFAGGALLALSRTLEYGRRCDLLLVGLLVLMGMLTHMYFAFFALVLLLWAITNPSRKHVPRATAVIVFFTAAGTIPAANLVLFGQGVAGFRQAPSVMPLAYIALTFSAGYSVGATRAELHYPDAMEVMLPYLPFVVPLILAFWGAVLVGAVLLYGKDRILCIRLAAMPALLILIPFLLPFVSARVPCNARYVLAALPFLLLAAAYGICNGPVPLRGFLGLLLLVPQSVGLHRHYTAEAYYKEDYRGLAHWFDEHLEEGDTVYQTPDAYVGYAIDPHRILKLPAVIPDTVSAQLAGPGRKIFVIERPWYTDPGGRIRNTLRAAAGVKEYSFRGFDVFLATPQIRIP